MDEQSKRVVCRMIAGLVAGDGDFDDREREFLDRVQQRFGIPESEWDAIFPLLEYEEAEAAMQGLDGAAQKETFELLLQAARADGQIADFEREYLTAVGGIIGLSEATVLERIAEPG